MSRSNVKKPPNWEACLTCPPPPMNKQVFSCPKMLQSTIPPPQPTPNEQASIQLSWNVQCFVLKGNKQVTLDSCQTFRGAGCFCVCFSHCLSVGVAIIINIADICIVLCVTHYIVSQIFSAWHIVFKFCVCIAYIMNVLHAKRYGKIQTQSGQDSRLGIENLKLHYM